MKLASLKNWFQLYKEKNLHGRYVNLKHIKPLITQLQNDFIIDEIGFSENNQPIQLLKLGNGEKKILLWSQMHGNESTTTKAVFDFINFLKDNRNEYSKNILDQCTIFIIPMLNPDGAYKYTRLNYNDVDLNRDAQNQSQKESVVFAKIVDIIKPDFAYNLHGQRTIFGAGSANKSATISFLAPAGDEIRSVLPARKIAMEVICQMNTLLQQCLPNQVGRYDDSYNVNCVGDTLVTNGIPTILFEAGHYANDYSREITREYIFYSLVSSIHYISSTNVTGHNYEDYFLIPENEKCFYDIIIRDVLYDDKITDVAIQFKEKLHQETIQFLPEVVKIEKLENIYAHQEIDGKNRVIGNENDRVGIVPGIILNKYYLGTELFFIDSVKK